MSSHFTFRACLLTRKLSPAIIALATVVGDIGICTGAVDARATAAQLRHIARAIIILGHTARPVIVGRAVAHERIDLVFARCSIRAWVGVALVDFYSHMIEQA